MALFDEEDQRMRNHAYHSSTGPITGCCSVLIVKPVIPPGNSVKSLRMTCAVGGSEECY